MRKSSWKCGSRPSSSTPKCAALFELPTMVYAQIMKDNDLRKKPYRVSEERIKKIIGSMPEFNW